MNPDIFVEWIRRQGHRVYHTESSYWYEAGPRVLQAFPYHWLIRPSRQEIHDLMIRHGITSLRYSAPLDFPEGKISYHIVLQNPYHLDLLKSQARNGIKRGLSRCAIEQISFERLATEGWILQQDTLDRQNRLRSMTQADWERICRSAADLHGFEAWAAIVNGELASALIVCQIDRVWNIPYSLCHRKFMPDHANNALFYSISTNLLSREGTEKVFFTVQSLDAPPSVDDFKLRMGLAPIAVRQRVEFHPLLRPLATPQTHKVLVRLLQRDEGNPTIAKAEGMLRFYVEGKQSLALQKWPECLASHKEEILNSKKAEITELNRCQIIGLHDMTEIRASGQTNSKVAKKGFVARIPVQTGDWVRVRSTEEIKSTLNPSKKLKGCAFLESMTQYCGTRQRVFKVMQSFLDESDHQVKKSNGVILLESVICQGESAIGTCDRSCFLFWREEWLEKVEA